MAILCLLGDEHDRSLIADMSRRQRWKVFFPDGREHARKILLDVAVQIILLDRDLAENDWRMVMSGFSASSGGACVLLASKVVEDYLWNEVVCHGGYDVVAKPLRETEVERVVRLARSYWMTARAST